MFGRFATLFDLGTALLVVLFLVVVALFVFEVKMFVSTVLNRNISDARKILWVVGMLLIHPFVAIGYYFTDYKKTV